MINKLLFLINILSGVLLLVLFACSYITPSSLPYIQSITLISPVIIIVNVLFVAYWLLNVSKKAMFSFCCLLLSLPFSLRLFAYSNSTSNENSKSIKVMSYNAHWLQKAKGTQGGYTSEFIDLVNDVNPDIIVFQEMSYALLKGLKSKYKYVTYIQDDPGKWHKPIFSKFKILNYKEIIDVGSFNLQKTYYVDIQVKARTLRLFNIHLSSFVFEKKVEDLKARGAKNILHRLDQVFVEHQDQVSILKKEIEKSPYPVIVAGDFNNNAFSYDYNTIKNANDLKDTFLEKGNGFGSTYKFKYFPTRIDFVMVANEFEVISHEVLDTIHFSDHNPIVTQLKLN